MSAEPASSFVLQLVGTLIGAFVGFGLVIYWDRRKKKTERKETRNMMIDFLVAELQENLDGLNNFKMPTWNVSEGKFKGDFGLVSTPAFQSIVSGGHFLLLPITLQKPIREIYHNAELFNEFMKEIIRFSSFQLIGDQSSIESTELIRRLQERKSELQPSLTGIIPKLKSACEK